MERGIVCLITEGSVVNHRAWGPGTGKPSSSRYRRTSQRVQNVNPRGRRFLNALFGGDCAASNRAAVLTAGRREPGEWPRNDPESGPPPSFPERIRIMQAPRAAVLAAFLLLTSGAALARRGAVS